MTFRDYSDSKSRKYTKPESMAMYEVLTWLKRKGKIGNSVIDYWHKEMYGMNHAHVESIIGPYCQICHCNLPGPNGEWE